MDLAATCDQLMALHRWDVRGCRGTGTGPLAWLRIN